MALGHRRGSDTDLAEVFDRKFGDESGVEAATVLRQREGLAIGRGAAGERAAAAFLSGRTDGDERGRAIIAFPEEARANRPAIIAGHVDPAIAVEILARLAMKAAGERIAPVCAERTGCVAGDVLPVARGCVEQ